MRNTAVLFAVVLISCFVLVSFRQQKSNLPLAKPGTFRAEQMKHQKVKDAYLQKWDGIESRLNTLGVDLSSLKIFIRGFKEEGQLEVWVKSDYNSTYKLYTTYDICRSSGTLGPKRCQGDGQVPEGFYTVSMFNPYSDYLLSLGVSYPNSLDRMYTCKEDPGGAIMIHGNCVTIGCIPITDDKIRELYVLAVEARNAGQMDIPIHLFPSRLTINKLAALKSNYTDVKTQTFWDNLKEGYDKFEASKMVPVVSVDKTGKYVFK